MNKKITTYIITILMLIIQNNTNANTNNMEKYKLILQRNIFDKNRKSKPKKIPHTKKIPKTIYKPKPKTYSIILTGIIDSNKQKIAFFYNPQEQNNQAVQIKQKIVNLTIITISQNKIILQENTKKYSLKVGEKLQKIEGEDWHTLNQTTKIDTPKTITPKNAKRKKKFNKLTIEERMKIMMERRNKELK